MKYKLIALLRFVLVGFILSGCSVIAPAPTPTPTATPTATATLTPTIDAGATQTVQAQSTATAQAQANATLTAQAQATGTARAQATSTAQAGATATMRAFVSGINAISESATGRPFQSKEGTIDGAPAPYITTYDPEQTLKNFDAQLQLLNPADRAIHTWDYGIAFRSSIPNEYRLIIVSQGAWALVLIDMGLADAVTGKTIATGTINNLDVTAEGSNTIRLFVRDGSGFLFVNDAFISALDVSGRKDSGAFYIATGLLKNNNFPGLKLRYKNLTIKSLP